MCDTKNHRRRHALVQDLRSKLKSIESALELLHQKWFPEKENRKAISSFLKQEKELCKSHITELENLALDDPKIIAAFFRAHWFITLDKKLINGKSYVVEQIVKRKQLVFYIEKDRKTMCPLYKFFEVAISRLSPDNYPTKESEMHVLSQILFYWNEDVCECEYMGYFLSHSECSKEN